MTPLDEILARVAGLPIEQQQAVAAQAMDATVAMRWVPNPGKQTLAYQSRAEILGYGGEVGGGKTQVGLGLALQRHKQSLILRRQAKEVPFLIDCMEEILGTKQGYNGQEKRWRINLRQLVQFGGCQNSGDEGGYKGQRRDLVVFDEATEFLESQVDFLMGWLGSSDPDQLCQVLLPSNPPLSADGEWYIRWFAPWLDPKHPLYQTPDGMLLYRTPIQGSHPTLFEWRDEPFSRLVDGRITDALSVTFVHAGTSDNPDYANTGYGRRLGNMPEMLRKRYAMGDFMAGMKDHERQVIPTDWVLAAQARWRPDGGKAEPMSAMALDPAGGGEDAAALAVRHGGWYGEVQTRKGEETADGSAMAAFVTHHRRNGCPVVVDSGGGYGGAVMLRLKDNEVPSVAYNGSNASTRRTKDGTLKFSNKRAEVYWRFREELDPDQEGGSIVALPPDPELLGDLTAPRYEVTARGIQVESKVIFGEGGKITGGIKKRLGRSTNKGDAVVMALSEGNRAIQRMMARDGFDSEEQGRSLDTRGSNQRRPQVVMGHMAARRTR